MYCTQCGALLSPTAAFCGNCGWRVTTSDAWRDEVRQREERGLKLCVKCRSEIPLEATVCHRCDAQQPLYDPGYWAPVPPAMESAEVVYPGATGQFTYASDLIPREQQIAPTLRLASVGRRVAAYAIDIVVLVIIAVIVVLLLGIDAEDPSTQNQQIVIYAVVTLIYFTVCEALVSQTPGKRLVGIKVVMLDGSSIGWKQSAIRNLMRIVDSLPALYIVGLIVMSRSDQLQRLGDKAAGTVVVHVGPR